MKKAIFPLIVACLMVGLGWSFGAELAAAADPKSTSHKEFEIQFLAGRADSAEFALTHGLSTMINKNSQWLRASVLETPGMLQNYELVAKKPKNRPKSIICGMVSGDQKFPLTKEQGGFPWGPYIDYRFVARLNETIHTYVTLDKNIKTFMDLKGKKLFEGRVTGTRYSDNEAIYKEAGIFETIKFSYGGTGAGISALRDGLVDVAVALGLGPVEPTTWVPLAPVQELMAMKSVYFVSYDKDSFERAKKKYSIPTFPVAYPPKALGPTQTEPVITKYDALSLFADKTMDNEVVYELLRIFDKYMDQLAEFTVTATWLKKENLGTSGCQTEERYHPGAIKYFREHGIPIRVHPW